METYTLIRLIYSITREADASNDVRVTYEAPEVEVIVGGKDLGEVQAALDEREKQINFYKDLQRQSRELRQTTNLKTRLKATTKLEEEILKDKNPYIVGLCLGENDRYRMWSEIEDKLKNIIGEYLIIPSVYKKLF